MVLYENVFTNLQLICANLFLTKILHASVRLNVIAINDELEALRCIFCSCKVYL